MKDAGMCMIDELERVLVYLIISISRYNQIHKYRYNQIHKSRYRHKWSQRPALSGEPAPSAKWVTMTGVETTS